MTDYGGGFDRRVDIAYITQDASSNDGHYVLILPEDYLNHGYPQLRASMRDVQTDEQLNDIGHR